METWSSIPGHEGRYEASTLGRIRSIMNGPRLKRATPQKAGSYLRVGLCVADNGSRMVTRLVHQLIAETFIGPRPNGMVVRHLNGDKTDNRAENLAYGTPSQNSRDVVSHGRHPHANATHCPKGHPYNEANTRITPRGHRRCRACHREWENARYRAGKK